MEPQAESISDMKTHMSIKEIYQTLEVNSDRIKYCLYTGFLI